MVLIFLYSVHWQMYVVGSYKALLIAFPNIWKPLGCSSCQSECLEDVSHNFIVLSAALCSVLCLFQQSVVCQLPW